MDEKRALMIVAVCFVAACGTSETTGEKASRDADTDSLGYAVNAAEKGDGSLGVIWQGELPWETQVSDHVTPWVPLHAWTVEAGAGSEVYIDGASRVGDDMFLLLYEKTDGGSWRMLEYNDDCYAGTYDACIRRTFDADGEYLIGITTYAYAYWGERSYAEYALTIWCDDDDDECGIAPETQLCGSRGLSPCDDGFYCDFPDDQCGAADVPGVCTPVPEACHEVYAPVCGCDGATYSNDCFAAAAGVDVSGLCEPGDGGRGVGEMCGGIAGFQCAEPLVCDYSADDMCIADAAGTCVEPVELLCTMQYDPVCGCDGITYGNDCMRRAAYVALDHVGACP